MNTLFSNKILTDFIAISTWQSLVVIGIFLFLQIGFWIFLKKIKIQFIYRVLSGMLLGLLFGIIVQVAIGFPDSSDLYEKIDGKVTTIFKEEYKWLEESLIWLSLFKNIFIAGVMMMCIPIVFLAVLRITSKVGVRGLKKITIKGVALLLANVAIAFILTFWLGYLFKVGDGLTLENNGEIATEGMKPIPQLISDYIPKNIVSALSGTLIIPIMVIAALMGMSIRILSKRNGPQMDKLRAGTEVAWKISTSMMMNFMKILPIAVMAMLATAIVGKPIGALASIGKVIGIGYLALAICVLILTLQIAASGINVKQWWKQAWTPFVQAFATQSALATLPTTLTSVGEGMKVNEKAVNTIGSMSTTLGLMACAGVQAGITTSLLWTANSDGDVVHSMGLLPFFLIALIVTMVASLGIAGTPGTATVVTVGVLGGMGFGGFIAPVLGIIQPLDGIFDMGRTGVNVLGANAVIPIVAKSEGLIEDGSPLLTKRLIAKQKEIRVNNEFKYLMEDEIAIELNKKNKAIVNKEISKDEKQKIKLDYKQFVEDKKMDFLKVKQESKETYKNELINIKK
ncbi:proton/glutamate symporter [Spiroplasma sp. TIUS-1]|uniref:cation:dicarboxylate symporter family transporter n=1 Tax=Spiroplasma sp. TIUS-1 TaxID=216963 RepID=UPI001397199A|nr:cation:dicarboxylase symporter family transporter [Spiroplasma sp. TIUS-1]QHX35676.1 proton/glutamate symporter [Spiroplasma sp. TIUS-1]